MIFDYRAHFFFFWENTAAASAADCSRKHTHCGRHHTADNTRTADSVRITGGDTHAQRVTASGLDEADLSVV